jgi:hypothetical protein
MKWLALLEPNPRPHWEYGPDLEAIKLDLLIYMGTVATSVCYRISDLRK